MKLKPLGDRLIVKAVEEDETTASRHRPSRHREGEAPEGQGPRRRRRQARRRDGKRIPLDVAEGDEVLYSKYGGTEIKVEGEDLLVLRESDVLAKVQS